MYFFLFVRSEAVKDQRTWSATSRRRGDDLVTYGIVTELEDDTFLIRSLRESRCAWSRAIAKITKGAATARRHSTRRRSRPSRPKQTARQQLTDAAQLVLPRHHHCGALLGLTFVTGNKPQLA
jgi:hypothetical protein